MIHAFKTLRLTNNLVSVTGADNRLKVGSNYAVYQADTGSFISAGFVQGASGVLSDRLTLTGQTLLQLIGASAAGVATLNNTSGNINLTGAGNANVIVNGQTFYISGDTGAYVNFAQKSSLESTGQAVWTHSNNNAINLSGVLLNTGQKLWNFTTQNSGNIGTTGQTLWNLSIGIGTNLSGNLATTGSNLYTLTTGASGILQSQINTDKNNLTLTGQILSNIITTFSGNQQRFTTVIPTGIDTYFITYPVPFSSIPRIVTQIEVTGEIMYLMNVRGRTTIGYTGIFSDTIQEISGVYITTDASIN